MMQRFILLAAALTLFPAARVVAQSHSDKKLSFEVASVKPNKEDTGSSFSGSGGRHTFIGATAQVLIMSAFDLQNSASPRLCVKSLRIPI